MENKQGLSRDVIVSIQFIDSLFQKTLKSVRPRTANLSMILFKRLVVISLFVTQTNIPVISVVYRGAYTAVWCFEHLSKANFRIASTLGFGRVDEELAEERTVYKQNKKPKHAISTGRVAKFSMKIRTLSRLKFHVMSSRRVFLSFSAIAFSSKREPLLLLVVCCAPTRATPQNDCFVILEVLTAATRGLHNHTQVFNIASSFCISTPFVFNAPYQRLWTL